MLASRRLQRRRVDTAVLDDGGHARKLVSAPWTSAAALTAAVQSHPPAIAVTGLICSDPLHTETTPWFSAVGLKMNLCVRFGAMNWKR